MDPFPITMQVLAVGPAAVGPATVADRAEQALLDKETAVGPGVVAEVLPAAEVEQVRREAVIPLTAAAEHSILSPEHPRTTAAVAAAK